MPPLDERVWDPGYSRLKDYVIETTGLAYYIEKDADLVRRISRRLASVGVADCRSYLEVLHDPLRGPSELDALITEITIGETHFFRHREHFDALRDVVLPDLINRTGPDRRLRIWCAGCADGSEPYSLSILMRRELAHLLSGWEVTILATDINRRCLSVAREGKFEEWSLRSTPEELRRACFRKDGNHWRIEPQYKEGVAFQYHNLVEQMFPSQWSDRSSFDLIVCRNVMIYFGPELMRRIVRQFHECLVPGAWLLVGPSEPNMTHFTSFRAVNVPGVTLYQKGEPAASPEAVSAFTMPTLPPVPVVGEPDLPVTFRHTNETALPTLADVRRRADQGDWEDAARSCEQMIEKDSLNSHVHFHHALVLEQMGKNAKAEQSLRRAIYLDRRSVLAHYHLALLLRSRGDLRQASRFFDNALELLVSLPGTDTLPDADGITVSELRKLAQLQLQSLNEHT
jgi:chemotaxis protein methyltransferase CheR